MSEPIFKKLEKLIEVGIALSSKINADQLLEMILIGAESMTGADGGTLYRIDGDAVRMEIVHNKTLGMWIHGHSAEAESLPTIPLYRDDGSPNLSNVVTFTYHKDQTVNIENAYDNSEFDFSGVQRFDRAFGYHSQSFLSITLKNHENDIIGVLQLINAIDKDGGITYFDEVSQRFTEALASQAAMVLTKQQLINDLEAMFESLIQLIANAIDDKSPYTGGHCRRVPELTMLLAEAAHRSQNGYLKEFTMTDKDRYELKVAGWLHDCGKIITPEYVVDKATKLETIFDRIALLETRYELLKRDAEIALLKQKLSGAEPAAAEAAYAAQLAQLDEDLAFLKKTNIGGEFMTDADLARLKTIAAQSWVLNGETLPLLSENELENLSILRGTLTAGERAVINHHIEATISMLENINFPKHLKRVREYAGGHHERMDGRGYPNQLTREQMSIPARCMAIADIFEALTAKDRPYKDAKTLSIALSILQKMKDDQHIDPDLYEVFVQEKVYLQYAHRFLDPKQIDMD